jgi:hypothetical protein
MRRRSDFTRCSVPEIVGSRLRRDRARLDGVTEQAGREQEIGATWADEFLGTRLSMSSEAAKNRAAANPEDRDP